MVVAHTRSHLYEDFIGSEQPLDHLADEAALRRELLHVGDLLLTRPEIATP